MHLSYILCRLLTRSILFPYTTLFRSRERHEEGRGRRHPHARRGHPLSLDPRVPAHPGEEAARDRKSTRLNSSHLVISYAVFCLKKKNRSYNQLRQLVRLRTM